MHSEAPRFGSAVADLSAEREKRRARTLPRAVQWGAMAATLAIGIVTGTMLATGGSAPVARKNGTLVASASLDRALSTQLASAPANEGPRIGLSFRDRAGSLCRSFSDEGIGGLACRKGEEWKIKGIFQREAASSGDYRMAAGEDPRLAAMIDESIAGEPFDAAAERKAMEQGWR